MQKFLIYLMLSLAIFATVVLFAFNYPKTEDINSGLSEEGKMLYGFIAREGKVIGEKYHMSQCCVGGGTKEGIWLMCLEFQRFGTPLSEEEARKLIINSLDDYLKSVNEDKKIRPFLKNYPFTPKNVDLAIYNYNSDHYDVYHPNISTVAATKGKIAYYTHDQSNPIPYKSKKYETYDEAVAILQQSKK